MLTPKQENFCLAYLETGNASEAYRRSYKSSSMSENAIGVAAKELLNNPKITLRLDDLRKPVVEAAQITLKTHLDKLAELRDKADASEKWQAAIQAEVARGKASGLYVEKAEVKHSGELTHSLQPAPKLSKDEWLKSHGLSSDNK
jgi:phage terminase small subunit